MPWVAENVSFALFSLPGGQPDALQPWVRIFGSSPQAFNQNPPGHPPGGQASGIVGDHQIVVTAQMGRVDIVLSPAVSVGPKPAVLSDVEVSLTTLETYTRKLISSSNFLRVALIMNLSMPATDAADATAKFIENSRLAVRQDATDLSFAINVPIPFEGFEGKINRICRWGTGQAQLITFGMVGFNGMAVPAVEVFHAATLQVDLNSSPQAASLSAELLPRLLAKLTEEARSIFRDAYGHVVEVM